MAGQATEPFAQLWKSMVHCDAYRGLGLSARCVLTVLMCEYTGRNNGEIPYGGRKMAKDAGISKATAQRAFKELEGSGFIVRTQKGWIDQKGRRVASTWRLTMYKCGKEPATNDYLNMT